MGRTFDFDLAGRHLSIRPLPVDEGWELWVMEGNKRLWLGGRVSVDDAVAAARDGRDSVLIAAEQVKRRLLSADPPFSSSFDDARPSSFDDAHSSSLDDARKSE